MAVAEMMALLVRYSISLWSQLAEVVVEIWFYLVPVFGYPVTYPASKDLDSGTDIQNHFYGCILGKEATKHASGCVDSLSDLPLVMSRH